jgi:hypothetical protein
VGSKFDFDSVTAPTLARFPYVLTTRAAYASGPPPGYRVVKTTNSYELWQKERSPIGRQPAETGPEPGRTGGCPPGPEPRRVSSFAAEPVLARPWSQTTVESGESATTGLDLLPGRWELSLQYDSTRPVTLSDGSGFEASVPGNLDYRGTAPYWAAGLLVVNADSPPTTLTATVGDPPAAGRLLGAHSVAHLGALVATRAEDARHSCSGYVDWYVR